MSGGTIKLGSRVERLGFAILGFKVFGQLVTLSLYSAETAGRKTGCPGCRTVACCREIRLSRS